MNTTNERDALEKGGTSQKSFQEEISNLEGKLASLRLENQPDSVSEFPVTVQNELRMLLKNVGNNISKGDIEELESSSIKLQQALKSPLILYQQQQSTSNSGSVSGILSYLKVLSEVNQGTDPSESDVFWMSILEPIFSEILAFINVNVFQKCIGSLSSSYGNTTSAISASHYGTGFAFHQQLGILQKGVRILLIYMKRAVSNLSVINPEQKLDMNKVIFEILQELCTLMKPTRRPDIKEDFDIGLDVRCNIGVGICYSTYFSEYPNKTKIQTFFQKILDHSLKVESSDLTRKIETDVIDIISSEVNRISIAFGILNTWLDQEHDESLYFSIGKQILDIEHGVKEAVNLGSSRVLEIWIDKLARPTTPTSVLKHVACLFPSLEFFCFMYLPGHIDAVKNCCRNAISALAQIYDRLDNEKVPTPIMEEHSDEQQGRGWVGNFLQSIFEKPAHIKWQSLACIAKNTERALKALELDPTLPESLLTTERMLKNAANETYIALMSYQFQMNTGGSHSTWEKTWIDPLFATQLCQNNVSNWPQKRNIISTILNSEKIQLKKLQVMISPLLSSVIKRMNNTNVASTRDEYNVDQAEATLLAAETIKMAHDLKISIDVKEFNINVGDSSEESFRGLVPRSILHSWLWSENPQIRLAGLSLLVEAKKSSEEISADDFNSLKIFLKYNLHSQSPAFRQQFVSYFKKLVRRLKDGEGTARRKKNVEVVKRYEDFFRWLWVFFTEKEGLFPGANFGRRCQALECLSEITQNFSLELFGVTDSGNLKFLRWLPDSYENNKIQALQILVRMPIEEFRDEQFCLRLFGEALALCKSVKPPDSVTGRYLMTLLMQKSSSISPKYSPLAILEVLYQELKNMHEKVETTSLIQVASESPMYGCFRCIRMILQNTNEYKHLEYSSKYRDYMEKLLKLCFKMDAILFPVLGSAAPEGFLPGLKDSAPEETKQVVRSLSAQMLLVCAWRSMKEVCLLMADTCTWFKVEGEAGSQNDHLLTFKQVCDIGDHLLYLLKNLMHRGVFEQVYVGFKQLATRLWKSTSQSLSQLPEKWLKDAMDQEHISSKSITRRSAGLPFIFQALLSAECDNEPFLQKWIQRLLILDESPEMAPVRIHSMNVLRGLFRDSGFSSAMMPHVPHGLKMAFRGLKSADWTERNSGLMLYGAVMRRSFGAKLNLMNAPTFFRKFSQMYDFLMDELNICIKLMETRQKERESLKNGKIVGESKDVPQLTCDFTFHLLLLLSSFTATCRVEDTHFKLGAFIPTIRKCGESDDMEVRKLSAKALIPFLISPEDKRELMLEILEELGESLAAITENKLHGALCQLLTIAQHLPRDDSQSCKDSNARICTKILSVISSTYFMSPIKSPSIFEALMNILLTLNFLQCVPQSVILEKGVNVVMKRYETRFSKKIVNRNIIPGLPVADKALANAIIQIMFCGSVETFMEYLYNHITNQLPNSKPFIEEFLSLFQQDIKFYKAIFGGDTTNDGTFVVAEAIVKSYLERSSTEFSKLTGTDVELGYLKFIDRMPPALFNDLDKCNVKALSERLISLCEEKNQGATTLQIKAIAFQILGNISLKTEIPISQDCQDLICEIAVNWSASGADDDMRLAVAQSYPSIPFQSMRNFSVQNRGKLWASMFMLAQDDEGYIREIINRKLTGNEGNPVCDRKSLEILVRQYIREFVLEHWTEGFLVLFGLLQRNDMDYEVSTADDESDERLFDKSEMNMFFEHRILAGIIINELSLLASEGTLKNECLNKILTKDQTSLYCLLINKPDLLDDSIREGLSLREILLRGGLREIINQTELCESNDKSKGSDVGISVKDSFLLNQKNALEIFRILDINS